MINFDDIAVALENATPEQIQMLRELVAPITKIQRLQAESDALASRVEVAASFARNLVAGFANKVHNNDLTAVAPTWEEVIAEFAKN